MSKAGKFIEDYTRKYSNEQVASGNNSPWLTPDDARKAVEIAREETLLEVATWINDTFVFSKQSKEDFSQTFNIKLL